MNEYEKYLEEYRTTHRINMWNEEVIEDLMKKFNLSYDEAFEARKNWYFKYERNRIF